MEELATNQFLHSEYITTLNKDILAIYLWANNPQDLDAKRRLTMTHLAVIIKYQQYLEDSEKNKNLIIDPKYLTSKALNLIGFIDDINFWLEKLDTSPFRIENYNGGKIGWMLKAMKPKYPNIDEKQLEEGYELNKFRDLLHRGIHFEESYLTGLKIRFDLVPFYIKIEFLDKSQ